MTAAADVAEGCYCLATQGRAGQVLDESRQMLNVQCAEASQKYCMQRVQQSAQSRWKDLEHLSKTQEPRPDAATAGDWH